MAQGGGSSRHIECADSTLPLRCPGAAADQDAVLDFDKHIKK